MLARAASSLASRNSALANSRRTSPMASKKSAPRFAIQNRVVLPGSEKAPLAAATGEQPSPASARITVSVIVRRKQPLKAANRLGKERLTRAQYRQAHAADPGRHQARSSLRKGVRPHSGSRNAQARTSHHQAHRHSCGYAESLRRQPRSENHRRPDLSHPRGQHPAAQRACRPRRSRPRPR